MIKNDRNTQGNSNDKLEEIISMISFKNNVLSIVSRELKISKNELTEILEGFREQLAYFNTKENWKENQ
ncbi:MAG: hypothetical protein NXI00_05920 [Cytophagales bacterium]|nr:hypothetical protein [Cytophagales bacterium]